MIDVHQFDEQAEAAIKGEDDPRVSASLIRNRIEAKVMENRRRDQRLLSWLRPDYRARH